MVRATSTCCGVRSLTLGGGVPSGAAGAVSAPQLLAGAMTIRWIEVAVIAAK